MEKDRIRTLILNLRDPTDWRVPIKFSNRSILFLMHLFEGKEIDDIDLHDWLLRMTTSSSGAYSETGWITLKSIIVYLLTIPHPKISMGDIRSASNIMREDKDNKYMEVMDMKRILNSIS